jgi:thiol-disulfide isomerase/thioredoxin
MTSSRTICAARALAAAMLLLLLDAHLLAAGQPPANFVIHPAPKPVPEISFTDATQRAVSLKDFRGRFVLLNIWATWCGPCRKEMPTLDRLQARLGNDTFQVVALSIDRAGASAVQKFYAETGVHRLAIFIDTTGRAGSNLALFGLPGTLLIDPEGREIARLIGPAEWDSPEMVAFLQSQIAQTDARRANAPNPTQRDNEASNE